MHPEFREVEELFLAALEHSDKTRLRFVQSRCINHEELAEEVCGMLAAHEKTSDFLEAPAFQTNASLIVHGEVGPKCGDRIGHYVIRSQIAQGSMGEVFLADDDDLQRRVALKLIRGWGGASLLAHFRREARILAGLTHPGIARLYNAAVTAEGAPYLVMEYVEGQTLDAYCKEKNLPLNDRLTLFELICAAVSYAHQHLVIHRDLKPANIRVTNEGEPKLLDFGIARVLDAETTHAGEHTLLLERAMTPEYASPEQLRGENLTTASDVYTLGVILYELLAGRKPERGGQRPPAPSSVATEFATALRGDLDNILLKALREEPERRYLSVGEFAEDIRRYLRGLPVAARKDSWSYRAGKFARRHHAAVAIAAVLALSLVVGTATTAWQAQAARKARRKAETISSFLQEMVSYSNPYVHNSSSTGQNLSMNEVLDAAAARLDGGEFDKQPAVKAELERMIAESYFAEGRDQLGNAHIDEYIRLAAKDSDSNEVKSVTLDATRAARLFGQGELKAAEATFRQVLPRLRREHARNNVPAKLLVDALDEFAYIRRTQGDSKEAEAAFREALAFSGELPRDRQYLVAITRATLASTLADEGKFQSAVVTARDAVESAREAHFAETPAFGFCLTILGGFLVDDGKVDESLIMLKDGETLFRRFLQPSHLWLGDNLRNQALALYKQERLPEALAKADECLKIYREGFGPHYDQYPTALLAKGLILTKSGEAEAGEMALREGLKLRRDSLPPGHFWVAQAEGALGECLLLQKRVAEAAPLMESSYQKLMADFGADDPRTKEAARRVAQLATP